MLDWLWIIGGFGIAILFFNIIEDWTNINDRIEDGTDPQEHDEWPT